MAGSIRESRLWNLVRGRVAARFKAILQKADNFFNFSLDSSFHKICLATVKSTLAENRLLAITIIATVGFPAYELLFRR